MACSVYHSRIMAGKISGNGQSGGSRHCNQVYRNPETVLQWDMPCSQVFRMDTAFVKNSYVGRTFIKPKQKNRESSVQIKLNRAAER